MRPLIKYEDNHLIVAVKPAGMLSQSDGSGQPDILTWVKAWLKEKYMKPGDVWLAPVHRLDRPVAGLMVLAKTSKAASRLSDQMRRGVVGKRYFAVIRGALPAETGRLTDLLAKDKRANMSRVVEAGEAERYAAKEARLRYRQLQTITEHSDGTQLSLLGVELDTGRSHQIRVQLAARGCPIWGDRRYGQDNYGSPALVSCGLSFRHPVRPETMYFSLELPPSRPFSAFKPQLAELLFTDYPPAEHHRSDWIYTLTDGEL
ncbi:MAG: RluA family pseudouridine synthase [Clostridiaceae bacterium]|nr:RluA family pseudouridine synthase [Clostridiaceae bacterium]